MYRRFRKNAHYLSRVPPQHRKRKFLSWLEANIQPFHDGEKMLKHIDEYFELEHSKGVQMDVTGDIVGRNRVLSFDPIDGTNPVLDDETYRLLQKAKISLNQWDGTIPGIFALWENLMPQYRLIVQDNQNMTMDLYIVGAVTNFQRELLVHRYTAPKPMGVLMRLTFVYEHDRVEHNFYAGGAFFNGSTELKLPPVVRDVDFGTKQAMAGAFFDAITEQTLSPFVKNLPASKVQTAGAFFNAVTEITLPQVYNKNRLIVKPQIAGHVWLISEQTLPPMKGV